MSSSPPEVLSDPHGLSLASSSPPPVFTFSSTPPEPISSSSPSWSEGSTTTVSTSAELEFNESGFCAPDEQFTRRLRELLSEVQRLREEADEKASCADAQSGIDFINTFQAAFDPRTMSFSTSSTGTETDTEPDTDVELDSFFCIRSQPSQSSFSFDADTEMGSSPFQNLSPIVFASSPPLSSPGSRIHLPTFTIDEKTKLGFSSRVIHRASSYLCTRHTPVSSVSDIHSDTNPREEEHESEPPRKRPKILTRTSMHTRLRTNLARTPASLRRAASLRSVPDDDNDDNKENIVSTVPASPYQTTILVPPNARGPGLTRSKSNNDQGIDERMEVPIIAPPHPLPPPSTESPAYLRIQRFMEREKALRSEEGLEMMEGEEKWEWECIGEELRGEVVAWFMEVLPLEENTTARHECHDTEGTFASSEDGSDTCVSTSVSDSDSDSSSDASSRMTCYSFTSSTNTCTTTVSPTSEHSSFSLVSPSSSTITSSSTTVTTDPYSFSSSRQSPCRRNLADQLSTSPETRFHAAYLFLRFFNLVGGRGKAHSDDEEGERWAFGGELDEEGRRLVTWDVGIACLGISVKYHRDFLHPLLPVYAYEFRKMAPHGPMGYDDLETAHRDVLGALEFRLGDTPQGLLSEVWEGVPSLHKVLSRACGRRGGRGGKEGWNSVQRETWRVLCAAVLEPDVLKFPISLLTVSALLHGLCIVLVRRYEDSEPWYMYEMCAAPGPPVASSKARREREERTEKAIGDVKRELVGLLCPDEETLEQCRMWLRSVHAVHGV